MAMPAKKSRLEPQGHKSLRAGSPQGKKAVRRPGQRNPAAKLAAGDFLNKAGTVSLDSLTRALRLSKGQLAETAGLAPETFYREERLAAPKTQARLKEIVEIVALVQTWAGGPGQAMAWYRSEPLPEFGGRTAEALVKEGRASDIRDYLDHVALGGFA
jgi:hypothetical protein